MSFRERRDTDGIETGAHVVDGGANMKSALDGCAVPTAVRRVA